jgi:CRP/FNR family transcriptional regulator, cyclic AMP receptor protein
MTELKTGQRPVQQNIKTFKPGDVLFEEGTLGKELFIIQEGKVGVYKDAPDGRIELAQIEKGGIIGEMSLLDNLPRSATIAAIDLTKALVVNQGTFAAVLQSVPPWLSSIIKIVVSRLRDANKRVDQSVLLDKERGLVSLMLMLLPSCKREVAGKIALDYDMVTVEAFFVCRLRKKDTKKYLENIAKRGIIEIDKEIQSQVQLLFVTDLEVLILFEEFLILKSQKKEFKESSIPDDTIAMLSNIAYVAQKSGQESEEGTTLLKSALAEDLADKNPEKLEKSLLDLRRRNLINLMPSEKDVLIIFQKNSLSRIKKIKEWLPRFSMEIK